MDKNIRACIYCWCFRIEKHRNFNYILDLDTEFEHIKLDTNCQLGMKVHLICALGMFFVTKTSCRYRLILEQSVPPSLKMVLRLYMHLHDL